MKNEFIIPFSHLSSKDVAKVGGKNASLGEMIHHLSELGIAVPDGFAVTVKAWHEFISFNTLAPLIRKVLDRLNRMTLENLSEVSSYCRELIMKSPFPDDVTLAIRRAHGELMKSHGLNPTVAVRSSATAEDSPTASFAGQHDSFLNIGGSDNVLHAVKQCYASLFNERAIKYRIDNGFSDMQVGQSVGVQVMVRSDKGSAGVAFTIDPESGNKNLIYITGAWGLGESVVQGAVNTDEFYVFKHGIHKSKSTVVHRHLGSKEKMLAYAHEEGLPGQSGKSTTWKATNASLRDQYVLRDDEVQLLGSWCAAIEKHYGLPMDIEWAKDGINDKIYIVQARPETVQAHRKKMVIKEYKLHEKKEPLLRGKAVGRSIVSGAVCIVKSLADAGKVKAGDVIVADITNPDWNALLLKAICIVTNQGGRTSHASIVARELGIPAVVGTLDATEKLTDGQVITVSCESG
ncbi:MAG: phosphoenolpyruvate synthase, partial [Cyclobacteriaceae bacterium]|nr:phosphoenolpyruvate synthase [Cyclobacteriaceae bacterium]